MKMNKFFSGLTLAILIIGCDKISDPIPRDLGTSIDVGGGVEIIAEPEFGFTDSASIAQFIDTNTWRTATGADNSTRRFIVLEEFTGHKCTSCPKGACQSRSMYLNNMKKRWEIVSTVALHAMGFKVEECGVALDEANGLVELACA